MFLQALSLSNDRLFELCTKWDCDIDSLELDIRGILELSLPKEELLFEFRSFDLVVEAIVDYPLLEML